MMMLFLVNKYKLIQELIKMNIERKNHALLDNSLYLYAIEER